MRENKKIEESESENLYRFMLENGDIFEVLPNAQGEYEKDKKRFLDIMSKML